MTNADAITRIVKDFGLHNLDAKDILTPQHVVKVEEYKGRMLIVLNSCYYDVNNEMRSEHISILVANNTVITFTESNNPVFEAAHKALLSNMLNIRKKGSGLLLAFLLNTIIANLVESASKVEEILEDIEETLLDPKNDQGNMGEALAKLAEEDPTFRAHTDQETGQTIIAGMGELHLEVIVDRLLREFNVEANVGAPQVAYKETFTKEVEIDSKYAKQSGGRGQYGHCRVRFTPMDPNGENTYEFESTVVGGAIPKEYIPAVGEGIEEAMKAGILGGFPVVGVHANVYDGSYHEVDSSEMAFHIAGSLAFKDAMQKASPILLEPIMRVEVTTPEDYMGDVIGDINSRRGRIEGMDDIGGGKMIRGFVPLSEMFGYATDLRSRTQGRGNYSMFFEKYEQVPKSVQEKILSKKD